MNVPLRIAVADDEVDMQEYFQEVLTEHGHQVVAVVSNGQQLVAACEEHRPDLVITDIQMPQMDGLEAAREIYQRWPIPVIVVTGHRDTSLIDRAGRYHVMAYLVKPIKESDIEPAISIAVRRFQEFQSLHSEAASLRQALADRKVIERAKGLLMAKGKLDEPTAFRRLQKLASDKNKRLVEVAEMIILADEAFAPPDKSHD